MRTKYHCPICGKECNYLQGGKICRCFHRSHDFDKKKFMVRPWYDDPKVSELDRKIAQQ